MKRVAIVGMGLMGGSLGLALKGLGLARIVACARRRETRQIALERGAADEAFELPVDAVRDADIVIFCTPVRTIPPLAEECREFFKDGAIVTDVGSTKAEIVRQMEILFSDGRQHFVGSHPMAGSEKTGIEAARADLYRNAVVAVTPSAAATERAAEEIGCLWASVGARPVRMDAAAHDHLVARTSHLPHLIAACLVSAVGREINGEVSSFCGPGFRDATRIASGSADLWRDIVETNSAAVLAELRRCGDELRRVIQIIEKGDFEELRRYLDRARTTRGRLTGDGHDLGRLTTKGTKDTK